MTSTQWVEYHVGTKRKSYNSLPTSNITAEAVTVDGIVLSQTDNAGVMVSHGRSYTANGMILTQTNTVIECAYDHMGRRATKKVTVDGEVTLLQRYIYRGYLQIDSGAPLCAFTLSGQTLRVCPTGLTAVVRFACCDLTRSNHPALWLITWDPTQPIATRPLSIQKDGTWYSAPTRLASQGSRSQVCSRLGVWLLKSQPAYGWDLTKNICELNGSNGYIRTTYSYSPYGLPSQSTNGATAGDVTQPIQWSSEYNDTELGLVYYNYRHYNPIDGRWIGRDRLELSNQNTYNFTYMPIYIVDILGEKLEKINTDDISSQEIGSNRHHGGKANCKYKLNINYETSLLSCNIVFKPNIVTEIKYVKDDNGYNEMHEKHHASICVKYWNMIVSELSHLENMTFSKFNNCAKLASDYALATRALRETQAALENYKFDANEYILINRMQLYSFAYNQYMKKLRELPNIIKDYNNKKTEFYKECLNKNCKINDDTTFPKNPIDENYRTPINLN